MHCVLGPFQILNSTDIFENRYFEFISRCYVPEMRCGPYQEFMVLDRREV